MSAENPTVRREAEIALMLRLVESLTQKPTGSTGDAVRHLYDHLMRYQRAQVRLNETVGFGLPNPDAIDVLDACALLSERYTALTRSIQGLESARLTGLFPQKVDHYY